jgi:hypothetical protein
VGLFLVGVGLAIAWRLDVLALALVIGIPLAGFGLWFNIAWQKQAEYVERVRAARERQT